MWFPLFTTLGRRLASLLLAILATACMVTPTTSPASPLPSPAHLSPEPGAIASADSPQSIPCDTADLIEGIISANLATGQTVLSLAADCVYVLSAVYDDASPWRNGLP